MLKHYHKVLTIAGSDSGGGAGIQADIKTFSALGCYGMSVITALTAQNTMGVRGVFPVSTTFITEQIDAVMSDIGADAVKIGMLFSSEIIEAVAERLNFYGVENIILDPVMVAQSGDKLLMNSAVDAMKELLFPKAKIVTPNLPEASVILSREISDIDTMEQAARDIALYDCKGVLIKGGHLDNKHMATDILFIPEDDYIVTFTDDRIDTKNNHGTGCTLSSAIAAFIAKGNSLENAVRAAKEYISGAIKTGAAHEIGNGNGPVHHFYNIWQ